VYEELKTLKIDGKCSKNYQIISNFLNEYFISTTIRANDEKLNIGKFDINHPMQHLHKTFKKKPFPGIKCKHTSTKEIKKLLHF
jgi:hypothetical protein